MRLTTGLWIWYLYLVLISWTDELVWKLLKLLSYNSINENIYKHGKVNISTVLNKPLHKNSVETPIMILIIFFWSKKKIWIEVVEFPQNIIP